MADWKALLGQYGYLVADGAWGTELSKRGLEPSTCPELWNRDRPDDVRTIAASYIEAGSHIVLTNTFGASPLKLGKYDLGAEVESLNRLGTQLSAEAAAGQAMVFGSIGPIGEFIEPLGTVSEQEAVAGFAAQAKAMAVGGADAIVVESISSLEESLCALRAVKDNTDLTAAITMTFDKGPGGFATMMGVKPEQAAEELTKAGAGIVGSNCGRGIEDMIEVAKLMRPATDLPLWIKPNAGLPELIDGQTVFRQTPEQMAARVAELFDAGANIVGGCCGTTPEHIRRLAEAAGSLMRP
jgi:5-methyltetrahydrofolate--homocysteine methyltransferase